MQQSDLEKTWSQEQSRFHVNILESLAGFAALQSFQQSLQSGVLLVQMDNNTMLSYLNQIGEARSNSPNLVAKKITQWFTHFGSFTSQVLAVAELADCPVIREIIRTTCRNQWSSLSTRD